MRSTLFAFAGVLSLAAVSPASADMVDLGTSTGVNGWKVTAEGVTGTPYVMSGTTSYLTLSPDGFNDTTPVAGMSGSAFDGYATFTKTFNVAAGATGVSLAWTGIGADDRMAMLLNGHLLGLIGIYGSAGLAGQFVFSDGGSPTAVTYSGDSSGSWTGSTSVPGYFNIGGVNTIQLILNATNNGVNNCQYPVGSQQGPDHGAYFSCSANGLVTGDFKQTGFSATTLSLSYSPAAVGGGSSVDEPPLTVAILGLAGLASTFPLVRRMRRGRRAGMV